MTTTIVTTERELIINIRIAILTKILKYVANDDKETAYSYASILQIIRND